MAEYIERDLVLETLERAADHASCIDECTEFSIRQCISTFKTIPAVNVAPAVHGRWIYNTDDFTPAKKCSICGYNKPVAAGEKIQQEPESYCPLCGAKMDGGAIDEVD